MDALGLHCRGDSSLFSSFYAVSVTAKKTILDGIVFDSGEEAKRWAELKLLERAGEISNLRRQIPFQMVVNGTFIGDITIDFQYDEDHNKDILEETKGWFRPVDRFRMKVWRALYPHLKLVFTNGSHCPRTLHKRRKRRCRRK